MTPAPPRSLDDAELKRLTLGLIAAYQDADASSRNDMVSWLVPLAKEWGRRDIEGLFTECSSARDPFDNSSVAFMWCNIRAAALIGLSEIDPQKASQMQHSVGFFHDTRVFTETIFRNWAKQDPAQAWREISGSPTITWNASDAIRGLIAGGSDLELRKEILQRVAELKQRNPASESARRIIENLDRLGLPESDTAALRLKLEKLSSGQGCAIPCFPDP